MALITPDYLAIREAILRDIANQLPEAAVGVDSDYGVRAAAHAAAIEGLYQHQQWVMRQIFPDTADTDYLERHADLHGLTRKAATVASGTMVLSGTVGASVPMATQAKTVAGVGYVTTAAGVIGAGGTVTLAAQAAAIGSAGNQEAGTAVQLTSAPAGVLSAATLGSLTGGTDIETDAALLVRLLFLLRNPPCGGAAHDYYAWAMSVDGVSAAFVYAHRRGLGTTDVVILTAGGIPDAPLVASVQAYLETQRPVQADCLVLAPTAVPVDVIGGLVLSAGYTLANVAAAIDVVLHTYFSQIKPGDTVYLNRLRQVISGVSGVLDFSLSAPTGNVSTLVDGSHVELAVPGSLTWSA